MLNQLIHLCSETSLVLFVVSWITPVLAKKFKVKAMALYAITVECTLLILVLLPFMSIHQYELGDLQMQVS